MQNMSDDLALADRSKSATAIWLEINQRILSNYDGVPVQVMKKHTLITRVNNIRCGGRSADRLRDIEELDLALSRDRMTGFLLFNSPLFDGTKQERISAWGHPGLTNILKRPGVALFIDGTFRLV